MILIFLIFAVAIYLDYRLIVYTFYFRHRHEKTCKKSVMLYKELKYASILFTFSITYFFIHFIIGVLR